LAGQKETTERNTTMGTTRTTGIAAAALSAGLLLAGCGTSSDSGQATSADSGAGGKQAQSQQTMQADRNTGSMGGEQTNPMGDLVGPACNSYAKQVPSGAGSVQGMAQDPVAVAAGNNPLLTTLTGAVSGKLNPKVDLVDTLNGGQFTVFAPVDDAFAKLPKSMVNQLSKPKNADMLSSVLTYHVVQGQLTPDEITGKQTTVQGEPVKVSGSMNHLKVNGASVVCGGVHTANATVYLIDEVLTPPSMM
jgi:uncharacterized surface protein with fasciclin (FAS1) repeats